MVTNGTCPACGHYLLLPVTVRVGTVGFCTAEHGDQFVAAQTWKGQR